MAGVEARPGIVKFLETDIEEGVVFVHNQFKYEVSGERIYYHLADSEKSDDKWFTLKTNGRRDVGQLYSPGIHGQNWQENSRELACAVGGMLEWSGYLDTVPGNLLIRENHQGISGHESHIEISVVRRGEEYHHDEGELIYS